MPRLVYMNLGTLATLEARQFYSGFAEAMKSALIADARYYEWLVANMYEICDREPEAMAELVRRSCEIKRRIVEKDPEEKGERALLNFGHTIGHAIEKLKNFTLLHGECVALGCVAAAYISWERGLLSEEEFYEIRDMNVGFGLPISFDGLSSEEIVKATKKDKKMNGGRVRFILLKKIGKAYIDQGVTDEEMLKAVNQLNADCF